MGQIKNIKLHIVTDIKTSTGLILKSHQNGSFGFETTTFIQNQIKQQKNFKNTWWKTRLLVHQESWFNTEMWRLQGEASWSEISSTKSSCNTLTNQENCFPCIRRLAMCQVCSRTNRESFLD